MAAPTHTALGTPAGIPLYDGLGTAYTFALLPTFSVWETEADIPGIEGGEPINLTNLRNQTVRTKYPKSLYDVTPIQLTCQFDPNALNQVKDSLINRNGSITCFLHDGTYIDFYGYLKSFKPQKVKEGDMPMAQAEIVPTNWDSANRVEQAPVITSVAGT